MHNSYNTTMNTVVEECILEELVSTLMSGCLVSLYQTCRWTFKVIFINKSMENTIRLSCMLPVAILLMPTVPGD